MDEETVTPQGALPEDDPRLLVEAQAKAVGWKTSWTRIDDDFALYVELPNGRRTQRRYMSRRKAENFLEYDFTKVKLLGDLDACHFADEKVIEAIVYGFAGDGGLRKMRDLPGIEPLEGPEIGDSDDEFDPEISPPAIQGSQRFQGWRLRFPEELPGGISLELRTASNRLSTFTGPLAANPAQRYSLRLSGVTATYHDELLSLLNRVADATFFDLDTKFGIGLRLSDRVKMGVRRPAALNGIVTGRVRTPRSQYDDKPMSLYWYGRSSTRLPLLEYLAYYQVLEYYFPSYSRRDALDRLRQTLRDPRFEPEDDSQLNRVLALAARTGKGFGSERDQLKSTLRACTTEEDLRTFIESDEEMVSQIKDKQKVRDVTLVHLNDKSSDLITQVSNRIYDMRCRIVHAKEDGGETTKDILMPFSKEAMTLEKDITLVRHLAQLLLISGATRLTL
ncbi:hypothetical protein [Streptomyces sp. NPDC003943]